MAAERVREGTRGGLPGAGGPDRGGNVSLYNEGAGRTDLPDAGDRDGGSAPDAGRAGRLGFLREGDEIALVGPFAPSLPASELAKLLGEPLPDGLPGIDIAAVGAAQAAVREGVRSGALSSAHDIAEGGLMVALAECCLAGELGAEVSLGTEFREAISPAATGPGSVSPASAAVTAALSGRARAVSSSAAGVRVWGS